MMYGLPISCPPRGTVSVVNPRCESLSASTHVALFVTVCCVEPHVHVAPTSTPTHAAHGGHSPAGLSSVMPWSEYVVGSEYAPDAAPGTTPTRLMLNGANPSLTFFLPQVALGWN